MSSTLLIDLDDTLLSNDINVFLPEYLAAYARHVSAFVDPQQFLRALGKGTQAMTANRQPDCTLQEAFEATFFRLLPVDPTEFYRLADRFYVEVFPTLRRFTHPIPSAMQMVEQAVQRGDRLAVTTNPLFPLTANLQRLDWAGLPADRYPFELVGSFERFHFAKPDPAFYAETLAYLGWPNGPVVIVGDDLEREVSAGAALGLPAYWVPPNGKTPPSGSPLPAASGDQAGFILWLESTPPASLEPDFSKPSALLAILRSTPAALDTLLRDQPSVVWRLKPQPGEWSLTEIACHLRDVEQEVNLPRLYRLLESPNPFLAGQDTDRWADERDYFHQDGRLALGVFIRRRMELVGLLESLETDGWQLPARHAIFGPTRLIELAGIMAAHDRLHIQQILAVLKSDQI